MKAFVLSTVLAALAIGAAAAPTATDLEKRICFSPEEYCMNPLIPPPQDFLLTLALQLAVAKANPRAARSAVLPAFVPWAVLASSSAMVRPAQRRMIAARPAS